MEPKRLTRQGFTVIGLAWTNQSDYTIPELWSRFIPREQEIQEKVQPHVSYGLCISVKQGEFTYVAGFESNASDVPEGMTRVAVPEQQYAVFTHQGSVSRISETFELIYRKWLPLHGLVPARGIEFELYDDRFSLDEEQHSEVDIYVPLLL